MNQEEFQHQSKSANIQEKVKKFSKEKSTKIIAEIKKKVSSSKHSELSLPSQWDLGTIKSMVVFEPTILLEKICERPSGLTEVRRDGKDNAAVIRVIQEEFKRCEEKKEQQFFFDEHNQLRICSDPSFCMRWTRRGIFLGI